MNCFIMLRFEINLAEPLYNLVDYIAKSLKKKKMKYLKII